MPRYFCVYYVASSLLDVNRHTIRTRVIDTDKPEVKLSVEEELIQTYGATYLKHIRDLNRENNYLHNKDLYKIGEHNNMLLREEEYE